MDTVLRREIKYQMQTDEIAKCVQLFDKVLRRDTFSQNGAYRVRSLYFDTVHDDDFFSKINEQELRKKIRIRIYAPTDQFAKLELKQKQDVFQRKRSLKITRQDALALIQGQYHVLLKYGEDFAKEMYVRMSEGCYLPKTIIEYQRMAYMAKENNIRITMDMHIQSTEASTDLFREQLLTYPCTDAGVSVLEVKYDKFMLTYIDELLRQVNKRPVTASKYCMGRYFSYPSY